MRAPQVVDLGAKPRLLALLLSLLLVAQAGAIESDRELRREGAEKSEVGGPIESDGVRAAVE